MMHRKNGTPHPFGQSVSLINSTGTTSLLDGDEVDAEKARVT